MQRKILNEVALDDGTKVVVIDVLGDKGIPLDEANRNIYRMDQGGQIIWQVRTDPGVYERSPICRCHARRGQAHRVPMGRGRVCTGPRHRRATPEEFVR